MRLRLNGVDVPAGPPRQQAVLGFLALNAGRTVSRDDVVDAVWGESAPASAVRNLHTYVSDLRQLMAQVTGDDASWPLSSTGSGYRLDIEDEQLDSRSFERHLNAAAQLARAGDVEAAVQTWREGLRLWRGAPLAAIRSPYAEAERGRLVSLRLSAIAGLAETLLSRGTETDTLLALTELDAALTDSPLHQRFAELRIRVLHQRGRRADAVAQYEHIQQRLADELGMDPGRPLRQAYAEVLAGLPPTGAPEPVRRGPMVAALPDRPPLFAGREQELTQLERWLDDAASEGLVLCAIDGPPGAGKTALAVEFAYRIRKRFPDGCYYLDLCGLHPARAPLTSDDALRSALPALVAEFGTVPGTAAEQIATYRSMLAGRRLLLILDDAAHPEQVRPLLPTGWGSMVLVTSRRRLGGLVALDGAAPISMEPLPDTDAGRLLVHASGGAAAGHEEAIAHLARQCGQLPLALVAAAERLSDGTAQSPETLVEALREKPTRLARLGSAPGFRGRRHVREVISWSLAAVAADTRELFRALGSRSPTSVTVTEAAALMTWPSGRTRQELDKLAMASLLNWDSRDRYSMNPLLHTYAGTIAGC